MKKTFKNVLIGGGVLGLVYFLYLKFGKGKPKQDAVLNLGKPISKQTTQTTQATPTPTPTQPMVVYGGSGGKGGGHWTQTFPDTVPMPTQEGHTTEGNNQSGGKVPIQIVLPSVDNTSNTQL
tara:strand:+ start:239 stop:604 length:366 start_codon:yes stop_codon:yes gene_type:complete